MIAQHRESGMKHWRAALGHALPVVALMFGLFYYWFAIADRRVDSLRYAAPATPSRNR